MRKRNENPNKLILIELLINNGWVADRYGHYKKDFKTKEGIMTYRFKFQETSFRYEVKSCVELDSFGKKEKVTNWVKLDGEYYSKIVVTEDGSIKFNKKTLKKLTK